MPRKLRLSVYRRYQFKKKHKERLNIPTSLVVSIPRDLVTIHPMSLPVNAFLDASLSSLSDLKKRIEGTNFLSPGILAKTMLHVL